MSASRKQKAAVKPTTLKKFDSPGSPAASSRLKLWCFRLLLAVGIPAVFLGSVELILRIFGFGYPTAFLLPGQREGQKVQVQNNQFGWRFFGAAMARLPEPFCFPETKGPNTVRIIVLGESAALGDPEPSFGLPRMLQALLELRYRGTHFEVVNAAIVAINSNVILPIARDCAKADADIWVLYLGNNEVVGPFGAGTVFGQQVPPLPLIRAAVAFKSTRIGQLMDRIGSNLRKLPAEKSEWGGMEMFLHQQVPADDPRMRAVYEHFSRNLSAIIKVGRENGAAIVASTVAVNLKDCAPFASEHGRELTGPDKSKWAALYQQGIAAQQAGDYREAAGHYREAARIDDQFAELRYRQGSCALMLGETADARRHFSAARDLDTLRFRCDSRLNSLIRQTVAHCADPGIVLADAENDFAAQSPGGLPGSEYFYEHVHLTFDGNYLLARSLAAKLEPLLPAKSTAQVSADQPWPVEADCARRLAWSDWEKQKALASVYARLLDPPFTSQFNHELQLGKLRSTLDTLAEALRPPGIQAAQRTCQSAVSMAADDPTLRRQLAALDELTGSLADAEANARRAVALLPSSQQDWSQLGVVLAKRKEYQAAADAFKRAFELDPNDVWAAQNCAQSLRDLGRNDDAVLEYRRALAAKPHFGLAWLGLGQTYERMGRKTEAEDCYQKALRNRVMRAPELAALARFCVARGWHEAAATNYQDAVSQTPFDATLQTEAGQNVSLLGRRDEAEKFFAEAARLSPDSMQAHFLYGLELGQAGKAAEAVEQFREAVRIMPNMPEAQFNLGLALLNEGNYAAALEQFETLLKLDPAHAEALRYAQALRKKLGSAAPN